MMTISRLMSSRRPPRQAHPKQVFAAGRLRPHQVLILSLWCGLVAGPLEVGAIVLRKHTVDLNQFYWMSRHFVWLIPLTNLLIFLILGLGPGGRGQGLAPPRKLARPPGCSAP